jgi:ligand-binding sensor domain-containing protein
MSRKVVLKFFFLLASLLGSLTFPGQSYNFRNYTVDAGLPFIGVSAIYQDVKGNLWIGGYGGLSCFNGKTFTNYSPKNGLATHQVFSIGGDTAGNLWVGTLNGLSAFRKGKFNTYLKADGLPDDKINCLLTDSRGRVWVGTDKGVAVFDKSRFFILKDLVKQVSPQINALLKDAEGKIWIGTEKGIVVADEDGRTIDVIDHKNGLDNEHVNSIYQDSKGSFWIGTDKGIFRFNKDRKKHSSSAVLNGINTLSFIEDLQGAIWISTDLGLWRYDGKEFKNISLGRDLNANKTSCLFRDYEKNIWIGSYSGLFRYRSADFVSFGQDEGLIPPFITQVTRDRNQNLLVGTDGGGLYLYRDHHLYNYTRSEGLSSNSVKTVMEARDGTLWIGTDQGFCTCPSITDPVKKPVFKRQDRKVRLQSDTLDIIFQDSKGDIWFGQKNGVTRYRDGSFTWFPLPLTNTELTAYYFMEDQKHDLWIGTYQGGLFRYDGQEFKAMNKTLGMKSETYLAMLQDREGIYYFGTFEGVYMYDPQGRYGGGKKIIQFSEADGMSSDLVYLMTFGDDEKTIWIGTNQALNKLDLGTFKKQGRKLIVPYGKEEGFVGIECNGSAVSTEPSGTIWFGTVNGLVRYNPAEYNANKKLPKTNITAIRLFYSDTTLAENSELSHNNNNISFDYIGICLTNPDKVKYLVKLEGFDKSWSPVTSNNVATYSNLPSGKYVFKVLSCNNEGIWTSVPAHFGFTILAPFWKTAWFSVLLSLAVVGLVILLFSYRIRQIRERENLKVRIATNELKALRSQMNPHFIFNSLNSIQHFIVHNDEVSASKYLNTFAKLIRTILNNSEKATASIREELDSLKLYLELEALRFESKFEYEIIIDPKLDLDYYEVPTMLIQPFAENAIIHGLLPKKGSGKLEIRISEEKNFILCTIIDNGIGRKKAHDLKESSIRKMHKSFGMKITQDRLEVLNYLHKSNLKVNIIDLIDDGGSAVGTRVEIYIPIF